MSKFIPFCPCCQSYHTDDRHQNHCLLGHAEQRLATAEAKIEDITIKLIEAMDDLAEHGSEDALWDLLNELDPEVKGEA